MSWNWLMLFSICAATAWLLGMGFTAVACMAAPRLGLVDRPKSEGHKNHRNATAVAGGVAMWAAFTLTVAIGLVAAVCIPSAGLREALKGLSAVRLQLCALCVSATVLMLMGMRDDHHAMKAGTKFAWQFIAAAATAAAGVRLMPGTLPTALSMAVTVLWIATVINAINFFDNMDGLAGGTGAIAFFFLALVAGLHGQYFVGMFNCAALGATLGFLHFNRTPARIFMGDSGSHFLGYLLAVSSILTSYYRPAEAPTFLPVLIPVFILAIPLIDALTVVIIRLRLHQPIHVGDNRHISHRFTNIGLTRPQAVLVVWLLSFIAGAGALALLWLPPFGATLILAQILAMTAIVLIVQFCARHS